MAQLENPDEGERARLSVVAANRTIEGNVNGFASMRRLSSTAEGRLCMSPSEARVGVVICVLLGSQVLLVIGLTRHGMYELTGQAYVSDIMDGEARSGQYDQVDIMLE